MTMPRTTTTKRRIRPARPPASANGAAPDPVNAADLEPLDVSDITSTPEQAADPVTPGNGKVTGADSTGNGHTHHDAPPETSVPKNTIDWGVAECGGGGDGYTLDLSDNTDELPPPGSHPSTIADLRIIEKGGHVWALPEFKLDGYPGVSAVMWVNLIIPGANRQDERLKDGRRKINRLVAMTGVPIGELKTVYDLPGLFVGQRVRAVVAHIPRDGVTSLEVRSTLPI